MGCFGSAGGTTDPDENKRRKEANKKINKQIQRDKQVYRATHRLLLLGKYCFFYRLLGSHIGCDPLFLFLSTSMQLS